MNDEDLLLQRNLIQLNLKSLYDCVAELPEPHQARLLQEMRALEIQIQNKPTLKAGEEGLRISINNLVEGFMILSAIRPEDPAGAARIVDFRLEYVNEAGCRLMSAAREQLQGNTLLSVQHSPWTAGLLDRYIQVVQNGEPLVEHSAEYENLEDGVKRLKRALNIRAVRLGDGVAVTWDDVTQRRQSEMALLESEMLFRTLADTIPQLAWMADPKGNIFWYNQRWYDYTGATSEEMEGQGWQKVHHPEIVGQVVEKFRRQVEAGEPWEDTFPLRGKDGRYRWFLSRALPIRDTQGRITRWFGTNTDITRQREIESELLQSEARFRLALENAPITVFTHDSSLRYTWIYNPVANLPQAVGKRDDELFPAETIAAVMAAKRRVLETGQRLIQEFQMPLGNEIRHVLLTIEALVDEQGAIVGLRGTSIDLSEQRQMEARQREFQTQMEVQRRMIEYREKERVAIARDIHDGPLQSLMSTLFTLQATKETVLDEGIQADLERISTSIRSAVRELREVLSDLRPPALLHFGLTRAIRIHSQDVQDRNPNLILELDLQEKSGNLPEAVTLTLFRIYQQGITNILQHAQATRVRVRLSPDGDQVLLEIQDNGQGFVVQEDLSAQVQTGHLGLAGMKERAEAAGGKLVVRSAPGKGTVLQARVPR